MTTDSRPYPLDKARTAIARRVQGLPKDRHWTQAEFPSPRPLPEPPQRSSRGAGSLTAEQFLGILRLFNVAASEFDPGRSNPSSDLQNALARLGALTTRRATDRAAQRAPREGDGRHPRSHRGRRAPAAHHRHRAGPRSQRRRHPSSKLHVNLEAAGLGRRLAGSPPTRSRPSAGRRRPLLPRGRSSMRGRPSSSNRFSRSSRRARGPARGARHPRREHPQQEDPG